MPALNKPCLFGRRLGKVCRALGFRILSMCGVAVLSQSKCDSSTVAIHHSNFILHECCTQRQGWTFGFVEKIMLNRSQEGSNYCCGNARSLSKILVTRQPMGSRSRWPTGALTSIYMRKHAPHTPSGVQRCSHALTGAHVCSQHPTGAQTCSKATTSAHRRL